MNRKPNDSQNAIQEYERLRPLYKQYTEKLTALLHELLRAAGIHYERIEFRTKETNKFADKIRRPGKSYTNPIQDVTDLTGIRVVVFYMEDLDLVLKLLRQEFEVDPKDSVDTGKALEPHEFGYRSIHYIVTLRNERRQLTEWKLFKELKAEIQVRTVLQHAWASVSRAFDYIREEETPSNLRRRLFRLAGLFELADEEFSAIRAAHKSETNRIVASLLRGNMEVELSLDSLREYLLRAPYFKELVTQARGVGFEIDFALSLDFINQLTQYAHCLGLRTIGDFARIVEATSQEIRDYLMALYESIGGKWIVGLSFLVALMLIRSDPSLLNAEFLKSRGGWQIGIARKVVKVAADKSAKRMKRGRGSHLRC